MAHLLKKLNLHTWFYDSKKIGLDIFLMIFNLRLEMVIVFCFVFGNQNGNLKKIGSVESPKTGIKMDIITDQPGLQLYTGNFLDGSLKSKKKKFYKSLRILLGDPTFPNSPNEKEYPSVVLNKGEIYNTETIYKFLLFRGFCTSSNYFFF